MYLKILQVTRLKMNKRYVDANEVCEALGISKGKAYSIIRNLNKELSSKGFITVAGKCSRKYFEEKYYGYGSNEQERK